MSVILHVAQIDIRRESGMGRVAWHWREEFAARGWDFVHLGAAEIGPVHPALFPLAAWRRSRRLGVRPAVVLVHEPAGAPFVVGRRPVVAFSHGLERRGWQATLAMAATGAETVRRRSRLLFPLWRLRQADLTLRRATAVLVLNRDDHAYALRVYGRRPEDVFLYSNGADPPAEPAAAGDPATVLFVGAWLARKGVQTLVQAAALLHRRGRPVRVRLAGTATGASAVLAAWPAELRPLVEVVPRFSPEEESALYARGGLFVLPSHFEGQPLALLQAMAAGCCCIVSNIGGNRDLVVDGETGLLHPPGDAAALADRITECLERPGLAAALGERARRAMAGRTWQAAARGVADFVSQILDRGERWRASGRESER